MQRIFQRHGGEEVVVERQPCKACVDLDGRSYGEVPHTDLALTSRDSWVKGGGSTINNNGDELYKCSRCGTVLICSNDGMTTRTWELFCVGW